MPSIFYSDEWCQKSIGGIPLTPSPPPLLMPSCNLLRLMPSRVNANYKIKLNVEDLHTSFLKHHIPRFPPLKHHINATLTRPCIIIQRQLNATYCYRQVFPAIPCVSFTFKPQLSVSSVFCSVYQCEVLARVSWRSCSPGGVEVLQ